MNKMEQEYSDLLETRLRAGEVLWFEYECIKFRLADRTWFNVDFLVMLADGSMECHEVKGFMEEDANVKVKVAAESFPFPFFLCRKVKGQWDIQPV